MSSNLGFSDMLMESDIMFLANKYKTDPDIVRSFDDAQWCEFLSCNEEELPYYLFDEDTHPETRDIYEELFGGDYIEHIDEEDLEGEPTIDLDYLMATDRAWSAPTLFPPEKYPTAKVNAPPVFEAAKYRKPSPMAKRNIVVKHHFEIVR